MTDAPFDPSELDRDVRRVAERLYSDLGDGRLHATLVEPIVVMLGIPRDRVERALEHLAANGEILIEGDIRRRGVNEAKVRLRPREYFVVRSRPRTRATGS